MSRLRCERKASRRNFGHELIGIVNEPDRDVETIRRADAGQVDAEARRLALNVYTDLASIDRSCRHARTLLHENPGALLLTAAALHLHLHRERLAGATDVKRSRGRRRVDVVAAHRDAHVIALRELAVGGIESLPADLGQIDLHPGVRLLRHARVLGLLAGED